MMVIRTVLLKRTLYIAVGCKRTIIDTGYLKCLSQDNVTLRWDEIDRVVADGIKTKSGEVLPFDVIIFATGYSVVCSYERCKI